MSQGTSSNPFHGAQTPTSPFNMAPPPQSTDWGMAPGVHVAFDFSAAKRDGGSATTPTAPGLRRSSSSQLFGHRGTNFQASTPSEQQLPRTTSFVDPLSTRGVSYSTKNSAKIHIPFSSAGSGGCLRFDNANSSTGINNAASFQTPDVAGMATTTVQDPRGENAVDFSQRPPQGVSASSQCMWDSHSQLTQGSQFLTDTSKGDLTGTGSCYFTNVSEGNSGVVEAGSPTLAPRFISAFQPASPTLSQHGNGSSSATGFRAESTHRPSGESYPEAGSNRPSHGLSSVGTRTTESASPFQFQSYPRVSGQIESREGSPFGTSVVRGGFGNVPALATETPMATLQSQPGLSDAATPFASALTLGSFGPMETTTKPPPFLGTCEGSFPLHQPQPIQREPTPLGGASPLSQPCNVGTGFPVTSVNNSATTSGFYGSPTWGPKSGQGTASTSAIASPLANTLGHGYGWSSSSMGSPMNQNQFGVGSLVAGPGPAAGGVGKAPPFRFHAPPVAAATQVDDEEECDFICRSKDCSPPGQPLAVEQVSPLHLPHHPQDDSDDDFAGDRRKKKHRRVGDLNQSVSASDLGGSLGRSLAADSFCGNPMMSRRGTLDMGFYQDHSVSMLDEENDDAPPLSQSQYNDDGGELFCQPMGSLGRAPPKPALNFDPVEYSVTQYCLTSDALLHGEPLEFIRYPPGTQVELETDDEPGLPPPAATTIFTQNPNSDPDQATCSDSADALFYSQLKKASYISMGGRSQQEDALAMEELCGLRHGIPPTLFLGVFDGHGGSEASDFAAKEVHLQLQKEPTFASDLSGALVSAMRHTDAAMKQTIGKRSNDCGTTAVVACVRGKKVSVAHLGDSRAIISVKGVAVPLTRDHKPRDEAERRRIEAASGKVSTDGRLGQLDVSRGLGDFRHKCADVEQHERCCMGNVADVAEFEWTPDCEYMILATDGLWDKMNPQQVVNFINREINARLAQSPASSSQTPVSGVSAPALDMMNAAGTAAPPPSQWGRRDRTDSTLTVSSVSSSTSIAAARARAIPRAASLQPLSTAMLSSFSFHEEEEAEQPRSTLVGPHYRQCRKQQVQQPLPQQEELDEDAPGIPSPPVTQSFKVAGSRQMGGPQGLRPRTSAFPSHPPAEDSAPPSTTHRPGFGANEGGLHVAIPLVRGISGDVSSSSGQQTPRSILADALKELVRQAVWVLNSGDNVTVVGVSSLEGV